MKQITVIGSGGNISDELKALTEEVGREIAKAGAILVCGGGAGVMEAACKGAKEAGGTTLGILPGGPEEANPYVDVKIPTEIGYARNFLVSRSGDSIIVVNGALGTLSEICMALEQGKKVVLLEGTGGVVDAFSKIEEVPGIKEKYQGRGGRLLRAKTPNEAVELAVE